MTKLCANINLFDENHTLHSFAAGDTLPEWALAKVTNPSVFAPAGDGECDGDATSPIVPAPGAEGDGASQPSLYAKLRKPELIDLCKERELSTEGSVAVLIATLETADAAQAAANAGGEVDLFAMDAEELRALAAERGIDVGDATDAVELATAIESAAE